MKVTGKMRYSHDLPKGGMKIPASFIFKTFNQMREMTLEKMEEFEKRRNNGLEKSLKKKETKNRK